VGVLSNIYYNEYVKTTIHINDGKKSGDLLWKYEYQVAGSVVAGLAIDFPVDASMKMHQEIFHKKI